MSTRRVPSKRWVAVGLAFSGSHGCALDIGVREGRIVGRAAAARLVRPRHNHGRLGPKGLYGWQANNAQDRAAAARSVRRDGALQEASGTRRWIWSWGASRELLATKGSGALGFYTSGQLFLEDYYTLALIARGGIGTNHLGREHAPVAPRRPGSR
jgi:anaerobic selenocysteine-containing dehydrogenase